MRVAIVHDYLNEYGGAEKVLEAIHEVFPESTVFTLTFEPEVFPDNYKNWKIKTSGVDRLPLFKKLSKQYTFLYPIFFEAFDLSEFDIVISSWSMWSKAVITKPGQLHVSYCHTPPRFLYKYAGESNKRNIWYYKPFVSLIDNYLRVWDFVSSQRPDFMIANSENVRSRIQKFYRRDATVIYPPVKVNRELILPEQAEKFGRDYYLMVGRLSHYKNHHLVIEAFNYLNLPLRIAGAGREEERLKSRIRMDAALLGRVSERELSILYQNCKGVIFPVVDEDFGIVPVEALSYGKPVLAHRSGGVLETITENKTGMFFDDISVKGIIEAVQKFDGAISANQFNSSELKESVQKFDESIFKEKFREFFLRKWEEKTGRK